VKTKAGEVRVAETERRGDKRGSRKEVRRKGKEEGGKNNRHKKDSRRMGDLGGRGGSSKIRGRSKETNAREVL